RSRVSEVLALQIHAVPGSPREASRERQRRGTSDEVAEEPVELAPERGVVAELLPCGGELLERWDQHLGDVASSVRPEPPARVGNGDGPRAHDTLPRKIGRAHV